MTAVEEWFGGNMQNRQSLCVKVSKIGAIFLGVAASIGGLVYGTSSWLRSTPAPILAGPSASPVPPYWTNEDMNIQLGGKIGFTNIHSSQVVELPPSVRRGVSITLFIPLENVQVSEAYSPTGTERLRILQSDTRGLYVVDWETLITKNQSISLISNQNPAPDISMGELSIQIARLISQSSFISSLLETIYNQLPPDIQSTISKEDIVQKQPIQARGVLPSPSSLPSVSATPTIFPSPSPFVPSHSPLPSIELSHLMFLLL
jgi:hypothetical protein